MSYRMSERDYLSLAMYMSVVSLLQFMIRLGALGTHDTKLLRVVEVVPECIFFPGTTSVHSHLSRIYFSKGSHPVSFRSFSRRPR